MRTSWLLLYWAVGYSALVLHSFLISELNESGRAVLDPPLLLGEHRLRSGFGWDVEFHVVLDLFEGS